jgi:anti-sigma-K factor RskA
MPDDHDDAMAAPDELDELDELRALSGRLRLEEEVTWEEPPPGLWSRVAADAAVVPPAAAPASLADARRRRRPRATWVLAAAAALVAVVALAVVLPRGGGPDRVAAAELERLGASGSGDAELVEEEGGELVLRVETAGLDAEDGFFEVWVIDPTVSRLVSLGPLRPDGTYDLPPGLDPREFPVVDVSVEPLDGDPSHSGDSALRGQLTF